MCLMENKLVPCNIKQCNQGVPVTEDATTKFKCIFSINNIRLTFGN
jgi:hypothetical protein